MDVSVKNVTGGDFYHIHQYIGEIAWDEAQGDINIRDAKDIIGCE